MAALRAELSQAEFVQWGVYFARLAQREELAALKTKAGQRG